jgi:hypothetical protein
MSTKYRVISLHVNEEADTSQEVLETQRTAKGVAYEDASLIRTILGRKAWVVEVEA